MGEPQLLIRQARLEAYAAWKASDYGRSQLDEWCEANAGRFEADRLKLRRWIIDETANELSRVKLESSTDAQKIAQLVGATLPKALRTLVKGLSAVKTRVLVDRSGKRTGLEQTPDNEARISAAKEILKVVGGYAPEKLEVLAGPLDEFAALTDEQLKRELAKYRKSAGVETPTGINGAESGTGHTLLAPECDVLERRAGRRKSLQAFSLPALLPADPGRTQ